MQLTLENQCSEKVFEKFLLDCQPFFDSVADEFNGYDYLKERISSSTTITWYGFKQNHCIACAIIDMIDSNYGTIILHQSSDGYAIEFIKLLMNNDIFKKRNLELIQLKQSVNYHEILSSMGLKEKQRVRMHKDITATIILNKNPGIHFRKITQNDHEICANISFSAHQYRLHIEEYDVYSSIENRSKFSSLIRSGKCGKPIDNACLIMFKNNTPIGLIETVKQNLWGQNIGWFIDVGVTPDYQGEGLGKLIIQHAMNELKNSGIHHAGLAVTLSNKTALSLYESMGFIGYDYFVEIIG